MSKPYTFYIHGMTCVSCSSAIKSRLESELSNKLQGFDVDLITADPKKTTLIITDDGQEHQKVWSQLKNLIEETGFTCEHYEYQPDEKQPLLIDDQPNTLKKIIAKGKKTLTSHWFLGALGCSAGIVFLIAFMFMGTMPLIAIISLASLSVLLTLVLGAKSYYDAWSKWVNSYTLTMDTLFAISTISILVVSIAAFFVPWLPMMFEVGLLIYGFRHIGIAIEDTIKEKIGSAKFQDRAPKVVRLQTTSGIEDTALQLIVPNDVIVVFPGEIIPLDGLCEEESSIYDTIIKGAILPRYFHAEEKVLAGMRLADNASPLRIRVSKTQKQSYLARLDEGIEKSIIEKAPIEIKTSKLLTYFIPTVLALAVISGVVVGLFFPAAIAIQCAATVLVSACPCTLGLIIPLAVKTGMRKATENGVRFKSAKILQQAEQIDTVIFDLNGTLTTGVPLVKSLKPLNNSKRSEIDLLELCYALEKKSTHPIGKAIYSYAEQKVTQELAADQIDDSHHSGITAQIKGENYTIGSKTLMEQKGINTAAITEQVALAAGDDLIFIAHENTLVGYAIMTDPLRPDAKDAVNAILAMGMEVELLTGAANDTAQRIAKELGIKNVHADCVATSINEDDKSKTAYIHSRKKQGRKVTMIGDAANDAQAIAASDFGIAMVGSDEITLQEAGAIIQTNTLLPIASAFAISKQTVANIKQNLLMSLGYNLGIILVGCLCLAIGFTLNPAFGVAFMILQACILLLNVYYFKHQSLKHLKDAPQPLQEEPSADFSSHYKINKRIPALQNGCSDEPSLPPYPHQTAATKKAPCSISPKEHEADYDSNNVPVRY